MFAMQLLVIRGVSPLKAAAITKAYRTPILLIRAFSQALRPEHLLEDLEWQPRKRLGPALSKKVYEHFKQA